MARVSADLQTLEGFLGSEDVDKCCSNGLLLLRRCAEHIMLINNTVTCFPNRNKTPWMHPRSKHRHVINYAIVSRTDGQNATVTKAKCDADF